jgi:hypothetical protein
LNQSVEASVLIGVNLRLNDEFRIIVQAVTAECSKAVRGVFRV